MLRSLYRRPHHPLGRAEDGAALVEFAIVLPVMLILLLGTAEIGRALWYHQTVNKSVRDAVRYLTRVPVPLSAANVTTARNLALYGTLDGSGPLLIPYWDDAETVDVAVAQVANPGTYRGPDPISVVSVTATVPFSFPLLGFLGIGTDITVTVRDEQRHIGE